MADKKSQNDEAQDQNFANAAELARVNSAKEAEQNVVGGYDGVEVRDLQAKEVINPVRNSVTGELETDTRGIEVSDIDAVTGADEATK